MIPLWHIHRPPRDFYLRSRDGSYLFRVPDGICTIGRSSEMQDYFSNDMMVARCQAALEKTDNGYLFIQQTGLNPVTINGNLVGYKSPWTLLRGNDSLVIVGHQFDVIDVPGGELLGLDAVASARQNRDTVSEYEGFCTYATGVSRFVLRDLTGEKEYAVTKHALLHSTPCIEAAGSVWHFCFPGGDEPTIVPGLRGFIYDMEEKQVASVKYLIVWKEPCEYALSSPDGEILIKSYDDGSFLFFMHDEKIAHFRRCYDPAREYSDFGDVFPMDYYAWCVSRLSEVTRTLILSIPFIGHFGVSADHRLEELRNQ